MCVVCVGGCTYKKGGEGRKDGVVKELSKDTVTTVIHLNLLNLLCWRECVEPRVGNV